MDMTPFNFDLAPVEIPVKIGSQHFVLLEADGDAVNKWRNANAKAAKVSAGADGKVKILGFENLAESESILIAGCLYYARVPKEDGFTVKRDNEGFPDKTQLVPIQRIKGWPARISKALYDRILEISDLRGEVKPEAPDEDTVEGCKARLQELSKKLVILQSEAGQTSEEETRKNGSSASMEAGSASPSEPASPSIAP